MLAKSRFVVVLLIGSLSPGASLADLNVFGFQDGIYVADPARSGFAAYGDKRTRKIVISEREAPDFDDDLQLSHDGANIRQDDRMSRKTRTRSYCADSSIASTRASPWC